MDTQAGRCPCVAWDRIVRRAGGLLAGIGLLAVFSALVLYALGFAERAVPLGVGGLIVGIVGSMGLLIAADRLPPGGGPGL